MKSLFTVLMISVLAACSSAGSGLHADNLRKSKHLRTERNLPMTFPEIQMALFKHQRECGEAPVFKMREGETSYASVIESESKDLPWNQTIVFDLMWLQPTLRYESRTRVHVYSFYSDTKIEQRIDAIFAAITNPGECQGDTSPASAST